MKTICELGQQEARLIRAHIIPQCIAKFALKAFPDTNSSHLAQVKSGKKVKTVKNNGYFDSNILCKNCDNDIGKWEKVLYRFLIGTHRYEYVKVKLGILAILWKCHITTHLEFNHINLGLVAQEIHDLIKCKDASTKNVFPIFIHKFQRQNNNACPTVLDVGFNRIA